MLRIRGLNLKSSWGIPVCLGLAILTVDAHTLAVASDTSSNVEGSSRLLANLTLPLSNVSTEENVPFSNSFFMSTSARSIKAAYALEVLDESDQDFVFNEVSDTDFYSQESFTSDSDSLLNVSEDSDAVYADNDVKVSEVLHQSDDDLVSKSIPLFPVLSTSKASKLSESSDNVQITDNAAQDKVQATENAMISEDSQAAQTTENTMRVKTTQFAAETTSSDSLQSAVSVDNIKSSYTSGNVSSSSQVYQDNTKSTNDIAVQISAQQSKKIKSKSASSSHIKIDIGHTRCYEILEKPRIIPALIAWTDGYLSGITRDTISYEKYISDMTNGVIQFCKQNPQSFYWDYIHSNYNVHGLAD